MREHRAILGVTFVLAAVLVASAPAKGPPRATTVRGEILDMSCYVARGFRGAVHRDCGLRCVASGVCMGIIGTDSMLYMLTLDHARAMAPQSFTTPDPFEQCKLWVGQVVEVSGGAHERDGMHILEVMRARLSPSPAPGGAP